MAGHDAMWCGMIGPAGRDCIVADITTLGSGRTCTHHIATHVFKAPRRGTCPTARVLVARMSDCVDSRSHTMRPQARSAHTTCRCASSLITQRLRCRHVMKSARTGTMTDLHGVHSAYERAARVDPTPDAVEHRLGCRCCEWCAVW